MTWAVRRMVIPRPITENRHPSMAIADELVVKLTASIGFASTKSVTFLNGERFLYYCSCPTVRDRIAVYPVLFPSPPVHFDFIKNVFRSDFLFHCGYATLLRSGFVRPSVGPLVHRSLMIESKSVVMRIYDAAVMIVWVCEWAWDERGYGWGLYAPAHWSAMVLWPCVACYQPMGIRLKVSLSYCLSICLSFCLSVCHSIILSFFSFCT